MQKQKNNTIIQQDSIDFADSPPVSWEYLTENKETNVAIISHGADAIDEVPIKYSDLKKKTEILNRQEFSKESQNQLPDWTSKAECDDHYITVWIINDSTQIPSIYDEEDWYEDIGRVCKYEDGAQEFYVNGYGDSLSLGQVIDHVAQRMGIVEDHKSDFDKACREYEKWRKAQIRKGSFSPFYSMNMLERYSLPSIHELEKLGTVWYHNSLEIIPVDYNTDNLQDYLFKIKPHDTQHGCGLAWHEPVYFFTLSKGTKYIDGCFVVKPFIDCLNKYFKELDGIYQFIDIKEIESNKEFLVLSGAYSLWLKYGASPEYIGTFISHIPKNSQKSGYTEVKYHLYNPSEESLFKVDSTRLIHP